MEKRSQLDAVASMLVSRQKELDFDTARRNLTSEGGQCDLVCTTYRQHTDITCRNADVMLVQHPWLSP